MGVLTVRTDESEDNLIEEVKKKYNISTGTKALIFTAQKCLQLEKELAELKNDKRKLQQEVNDYRSASLDLLSGLSRLGKLTNKT